jgi:hypothetical protein
MENPSFETSQVFGHAIIKSPLLNGNEEQFGFCRKPRHRFDKQVFVIF